MSLPTLIKTWQVDKNFTVAAQGSINNTEKTVLRSLKNRLKAFGTNPATVWGSNDGAGGFGNNDANDRWTSDAAIVKNGAGSNHSWIVLNFVGFQLAIDCLPGNGISVSFSPSSGFGTSGGGANGTATAKPTATDEVYLLGSSGSGSAWFSAVDAQHQIHSWLSTDGKCMRVIIWRAGTAMCTFWLCETVRNPRATWSTPIVGIARGDNGGGITASNLNLWTAPSQGVARARVASTTAIITLTGEATQGGQLASTTATSDQTNAIDGTWDFYPIGLLSGTTAATKGRHGMLHDIWWSPTSVTDADTFPNSTSDRQFVKMGGLLLPWDPGGSTVPLLT